MSQVQDVRAPHRVLSLRPGTAATVDAVVSSVLLCADPFAQEAAVDYWDMSAAGHRAVVRHLRGTGDADLASATEAVLATPADPACAQRLRTRVAARLGDADGAHDDVHDTLATLGRLALRADASGRLSAHLGAEYRPRAGAVTVDVLRSLPVPARPATDDAPVCIVVPFRDRTSGRSRLRNLLACLAALRDQSASATSYRVVVVEADNAPRWESEIAPFVDRYLALEAPGHFNKAWAVNAGVTHLAGSAEVVCVLDGDVLVDHDFVARNAARFGARGAQAHLPYRDALCLDEQSSSEAVALRVVRRLPRARTEELRGVLLRRPPGHCVWVRRELYDLVGGFDERFEGWGGEDLDFVFRLEVVGVVDRFDDDLLHLWHERPQTQVDGRRFYADRRLLSWRPTGPVGQLSGPTSSADDDLAGLIERVGHDEPTADA